MIDPTTGSTPWWMAGSIVAGAIVMKGIDWLFARRKERTETDANVELLNEMRAGLASLGDKVRSMEETHERLSTRIEEEIQLRRQAQEEAHRLKLRVQTLENAMRQVGAVIPPDAH